MTKAQALTEAKKLLGESAVVEMTARHISPRTCYVFPHEGASTLYAGIGKNWLAAIQSAQYKQNVRLGVWS